jgi:hypothetical protein
MDNAQIRKAIDGSFFAILFATFFGALAISAIRGLVLFAR